MQKMNRENKSVEIRDLIDANGTVAGTEVVLKIPVIQGKKYLIRTVTKGCVVGVIFNFIKISGNSFNEIETFYTNCFFVLAFAGLPILYPADIL